MRERIARLRIIGPRTRRAVFVTVAAIAAFMLVMPAFAGPVGINAGFEDDDGNLVDDTGAGINAGIDWNSFAPTTWTGATNLRTATDSASGWTLTGKEDLQATTADSGFAGGTKQDANCPNVITAKAPNKDDLKRVYLATKTVPVGGVDHVFLMLAWVRIPQNTTSPSAHIGFEFNKGATGCGGTNPLVNRTAGDMLIVYDFEGSSTDNPTLTLRRWVTSGSCEIGNSSPPCWGPAQNLTADGDAEGRVNTGATALDEVADPDETLGLNEFGEAGIDLTDAGVFTPGQCESFGNAYAVSRSSGNSGTAQMKDLVGPVPFQLQNCGSVKVIKQTDPRGLDQEFGFTSTLAGTQLSCSQTAGTETPTSFSLNDMGNAGKTLGSTDATQNSTANTQTCTNVPIGSYTVTEGADPSGFAFDSVTCTNTGGNTTSTSGKVATINVAGAGTTTCLYINEQQLGAIEVQKVAKNKNCTSATPPDGCSSGKAPLAGAGFEIWQESNGVPGLQTTTDPGPPEVLADTKVKNQQLTAISGTGAATKASTCFANLSFNSASTQYYVHESATPTGYAGGADQTVVISTNTTCAGSPVVKLFENTPLSRIQVKFTSLGGPGVTASQIVCKQGTNVVAAQSENGDPDNETTPVYDDTDETFGNGTSTLVPGVYTCIIDVDP